MKDWKKRFIDEFCSVWKGGGIDGKDHYVFYGFGDDAPSGDGKEEVDRAITFIESLFSEQEAEHKKQMRKAIEEAWLMGEEKFHWAEKDLHDLFKKYNCEECHHHVTSKSDGKCVKCGEQVLVEKD